MISRRNRTLAWLSVAALALAGCSSAPADYLNAAGDSCKSQRAELKAVDDYFNEQLIQGAIIGGVGGAAAGALLGYMIGGSGSSAAIGAAAGLAAGAAGGYFIAKRDAAQSRDALVQTVYDDVSRENTQVSRATAAFDALTKCRIAASTRINQEYQAGSLSRGDAEAQMTRERELFTQDIAFAKEIGGQMQKRSGDLTFAVNEVEKLPPGPIVAEASPAPATETKPAAKPQPPKPQAKKPTATKATASEQAAVQKLSKESVSLTDNINGYDQKTNDAGTVAIAQMQLKEPAKPVMRDQPARYARWASKCAAVVLADCGG